MNNTIKQLKHNNTKTQHQFYQMFSPHLFRVAYRYVNNEQDAASIVNSGFYNVFKNIHTFTYTNNQMLLGWMKKIVVNEALTLLRKKNVFTSISEMDNNEPQTELQSDTNLTAEDYYKMIQELPSEQRTVFNLYVIDGYNHKEIAIRLGIEESSSRVYLLRARRALQQLLSEKMICHEQ
ncbi:MAG: sigma-70 family RNA polymerase sigma factor [Tenuifilaceae bacterium]|jgi:RNA polymerase sigma-70 factor (ECF subfamily)|nr:sigma-70 family RNA polymerase sigma factor [Tenuifilaceae bacterium]